MDITIKINTDNDAFHYNWRHEVRRIIQDAALIECNLRDINGNTVGTIEISED